jgi:hypothetical protein
MGNDKSVAHFLFKQASYLVGVFENFARDN